jgi:hypothetical protein
MKKNRFLLIGCVVVLLFGFCGLSAFGSVSGEEQCPTKGTLWKNLSNAAVNFDLGVYMEGGTGASVTLHWTDSNEQKQSLTVAVNVSEGVTTSLHAGGAVTYSCSGTGSNFAWQLEQHP